MIFKPTYCHTQLYTNNLAIYNNFHFDIVPLPQN